MADDELDAPPGASGDLVDVFGSDIEDEGPRKESRSQSQQSQEDPEDDIIPQKPRPDDDFRPPPVTNPEDQILPQDDFRPPANGSPAPVPRDPERVKEPDSQVSTEPRQSVMDSLDDDDYEDEDLFASKKRKNDQPSSSKAKKQRVDSDDDEPARRKHDDDFIDDEGVERKPEDEDDVIRTEGGLDVSKDIEDDESEQNGDPETEEPEKKKPLNAFEKALLQTKALRRTRRRELDDDRIEAECLSFIERMVSARDEDWECYKAGKPALNKLRMLKEVEKMTTKVTHKEALIDNGLFAAMKMWLEPIQDGVLPNVMIRTSLLQILAGVRVGENFVDRLKRSNGLGRIIHYLSNNDDHSGNRRAAEKLMTRWARPVYQNDSNFGNLLSEYDRPETGYRAHSGSLAAERRKAREAAKQFKTSREKLEEMSSGGVPKRDQIMAPIPKKSNFLFTALAGGQAEVDERAVKEHRQQASTSKKVNKTMTKMRTLNKNRSARAAKPSLNGRNINM